MGEDKRQSISSATSILAYDAETELAEKPRVVLPSPRSDLIMLVQMDLKNKHRGGSTSTTTSAMKSACEPFTQQRGNINSKRKILSADIDAIGVKPGTMRNSQSPKRLTTSVKTPSKSSRLPQIESKEGALSSASSPSSIKYIPRKATKNDGVTGLGARRNLNADFILSGTSKQDRSADASATGNDVSKDDTSKHKSFFDVPQAQEQEPRSTSETSVQQARHRPKRAREASSPDLNIIEGGTNNTVRATKRTRRSSQQVNVAPTSAEKEEELRTCPPRNGSLHIGHSTYDGAVLVYASRSSSGSLTFKIDKDTANASDHDFSGPSQTAFKNITFIQPWFNGLERDVRAAIKQRLRELQEICSNQEGDQDEHVHEAEKIETCVELSGPEMGPAYTNRLAAGGETSDTSDFSIACAALKSLHEVLPKIKSSTENYQAIAKYQDTVIVSQKKKIDELEAAVKDHVMRLGEQSNKFKVAEDSLQQLTDAASDSAAMVKSLQAQVASLSKPKIVKPNTQSSQPSSQTIAQRMSSPPALDSPAPQSPMARPNEPASSDKVRQLKLKGKSFRSVFLKLPAEDPNAGKYMERDPSLRQDGGKHYMIKRILQDVGLVVASKGVKEEADVRDEHSSRDVRVFKIDFKKCVDEDGRTKLVQKFGKDCLYTDGDREFVCRYVLTEVVENEDGEKHGEGLL